MAEPAPMPSIASPTLPKPSSDARTELSCFSVSELPEFLESDRRAPTCGVLGLPRQTAGLIAGASVWRGL
jgi:hypothetical protein